MALNWDKLAKLKRDYPNPKFALSETQRQLKKRKDDPYLLGWQSEVLLSLRTDGKRILDNLKSIISHQPPINDRQLLTYTYELLAEATRRYDPSVACLTSIGTEGLKTWQNAAKTLQSRKARLDLWSELFICAMKEDCWEDVRYALQQASQERPQAKKTISFALILANQLAAEKVEAASSSIPSMNVQIQKAFAYKMVKKAYENTLASSEDPLRIESMRDVRFMTQIFIRQQRAEELGGLMGTQVPEIQKIVAPSFVELTLLVLGSLQKENRWKELLEYATSPTCCRIWDATIQPDQLTTNEKLLLNSWEYWSRIMEAKKHGASESIAIEAVKHDLAEKLPKFEQALQEREYNLTRMALSSFVDHSYLLELCKSYWRRYSQRSSCFYDLLRFVQQLDLDQQQDFHTFIKESAEQLKSQSESDAELSMSNWVQVETNVVRFEYLLTIAVDGPNIDVTEAFISNAVRLYQVAVQLKDGSNHNVGVLVVMGLLNLHYQLVHSKAGNKNDYDRMRKTASILLQAGFLLLHLTAGDSGKQDRSLLLLSTQIHLYLGLGTIAFEQYRHARVKEILNDTLSYLLLSGISQIHPFNATGTKKFSADSELASVIKTIKRMESKANELIYTDIQYFQYDQAIELLEFQRKLKSSATKHFCLIERRRIARLRGDPIDASLTLDLKEYQNITDNRDFTILPYYGTSNDFRFSSLFNPRGFPRLYWIYARYALQEKTSRLLYNEKTYEELDKPMSDLAQQNKNNVQNEPIETELHAYWETIGELTEAIYAGSSNQTDIRSLFQDLQKHVTGIEDVVKELIWSETDHEPGNKSAMPYERGLRFLYGHLEVLQASFRLCDVAKDHLKKNNSTLKGKVDAKAIEAFQKSVKTAYSAIGECATSRIDALKKNGVASLLEQAKWGSTGEGLQEILEKDEQRVYAAEYVDAAVEALKGVTKVKLK
ncbi:hypothetical protein CC78DRAFT_184270 [Lojkania enalia]|uniref:N-acetyltransferase B complex non catalytic subunit-domain-containing protein n=1 Tax=Lojkania enalia TaxID=147567 RepID=A0A9P4KBT9_9PLEO|nr:hypothetical protein CC78DRAFT_184270 [Didymosphaeria enalia]